jgi:hypothetical protein
MTYTVVQNCSLILLCCLVFSFLQGGISCFSWLVMITGFNGQIQNINVLFSSLSLNFCWLFKFAELEELRAKQVLSGQEHRRLMWDYNRRQAEKMTLLQAKCEDYERNEQAQKQETEAERQRLEAEKQEVRL